MIMREEDHVNIRQVMKFHGRIGLPCPAHAGSEMDMVTSMEEIRLTAPRQLSCL
jgi:hypothetical protein